MRRFDWLIDQTNLVAIVGVDNGPGTPILPLMASGYNSIAVGLNNGVEQHGSGAYNHGVDGPGRSKPDVVAPDPFSTNAVSYATPSRLLGGRDARAGRTHYSFSAGTNAATIKAIIMASTDKNPLSSWGHTATTPLDPQYGAGQVNLNWAFQVMAAGPQPTGTASLAASTGWSYNSVSPSTSSGSLQTYYFTVPAGQPPTCRRC